jgi:hypothetical protein
VPAPATAARSAVLLTLATTLLRATGSFTSFTYIDGPSPDGLGRRVWRGRLPVRLRPDRPGRRRCRRLADEAGQLPALAAGLMLTALSLAGLGVMQQSPPTRPRSSPAARRSPVMASAPRRSPRPAAAPALHPGQRAAPALPERQRALRRGQPGRCHRRLDAGPEPQPTAVCWTAAGIELAALTLVGQAAFRKNFKRSPNAGGAPRTPGWHSRIR